MRDRIEGRTPLDTPDGSVVNIDRMRDGTIRVARNVDRAHAYYGVPPFAAPKDPDA